MKIRMIWLLGLLSFTVGCTQAKEMTSLTSSTDETDSAYETIHTDDLHALLQHNPNVVLIDSHSIQYDSGVRIPGAKLMPFDTKEEIIREVIPNKEAQIVIYCTSAECPTSKELARRLVKMGYIHILIYPEGIQDWATHNYPLDQVRPGQVSGLKTPRNKN